MNPQTCLEDWQAWQCQSLECHFALRQVHKLLHYWLRDQINPHSCYNSVKGSSLSYDVIEGQRIYAFCHPISSFLFESVDTGIHTTEIHLLGAYLSEDGDTGSDLCDRPPYEDIIRFRCWGILGHGHGPNSFCYVNVVGWSKNRNRETAIIFISFILQNFLQSVCKVPCLCSRNVAQAKCGTNPYDHTGLHV
eukprot:m.29927 g.29927  ORF g.29927 m.29927 type:complete len:192 (+) comp8152_c0_seq1:854-1429(+)